jgi:hypothetical protein
MTLGPAIPASTLLALSSVSRQIYLEIQGLVFAQNKFVGYPTPLTTLLKRMALCQASQIRVVTVSVLAAFTTLEDNKTVTGLSGEVIEILTILCGMRGLQKVSVKWDGKHDDWGEAHDYFKAKVVETFERHMRGDVRVWVPMLGTKPQEGGTVMMR